MNTRWPSIIREYLSQVIVCDAASATSCAAPVSPGSAGSPESDIPHPDTMSTTQSISFANVIEPDLRSYDDRYNANASRSHTLMSVHALVRLRTKNRAPHPGAPRG